MSDVTPRSIGIAVVLDADRVLVGIRGSDGPLPGLAEFPGGKCEAGEAPADCAVRECREEAGLAVEPVRLLLDRIWSYPHATVHLYFWQCQARCAADIREQHAGFRWVSIAELSQLEFPPANSLVVDLLRQNPALNSGGENESQRGHV